MPVDDVFCFHLLAQRARAPVFEYALNATRMFMRTRIKTLLKARTQHLNTSR